MSTNIYYRVELKAGDTALDASPDVISLSVEQREMGPDQLSLQLEDPHAVLGHAVREGSMIEVELGVGSASAILFRGKIYQTSVALPERGVPTVSVTAYDRLMELGLTEINAVHEKPLFECVSEALGDTFANVDYDVDLKLSFKKFPCVQSQETNLHFLQRLARMSGCLLYVEPGSTTAEGDTVCFVERKKVLARDPALRLTYGRPSAPNPLLRFQARASVSAIKAPTRFVAVDEDGAKVTEETALGGAITTDDALFIEGLSALELRDAKRASVIKRLAVNAAKERKTLLEKVTRHVERGLAVSASDAEVREAASASGAASEGHEEGSGVAEGRHGLIARSMVDIQNVPAFSGTWLLVSARHVLDKQGYRTEIQCRR